MKVAIAVRRFEKTGGVERAAVELALGVRKSGHPVNVFASICDRKLAQAIRVTHIPSLTSFGSGAIASFHLSTRRRIDMRSHDIVHAHGLENSVYNVMTFQSCHQAGVLKKTTEPRGRVRKRNFHVADHLRLFLERSVFKHRHYKHLIAVSDGVKRELCDLYNAPPGDITVIPNGVNHIEFSPATHAQRIELRNRFNIADDHLVLLFVANEFERKGLQVLLDALTLLKHLQLTLLVVGKDDPREYTRYAHSHRLTAEIRYVGLANDMNDYYRASDVFVLPTYYEAFSLATVEAAACGLPLLVTRVNGTEELIRDGLNGMFIERHADDIAAKIQHLLDQGRRTALSRAAYESSLPYSWPVIVKRTLNVYESILASD